MSKNGYTRRGFFGGYDHYDNNGHKTAESTPGLFDDLHHKKK